MTHNVHFLLIKASSAADAARIAVENTCDWGDINNYSCIGGIASEDGNDDIDNHDDGGWSLAFLNDENVPKDGTYFSRAAHYISQLSAETVISYGMPEHCKNFRAALDGARGQLEAFNPDNYNGDELGTLRRHLKHLYEVIGTSSALKTASAIPELHAWDFMEEGCTDMTHLSCGDKRYMVFLDMHS